MTRKYVYITSQKIFAIKNRDDLHMARKQLEDID
jgi:hypothetical protein